MNPAMANVINPTEVVVVSTFQVDLEGGSGEFHVAMPYSMLEPIRDLLVSGFQNSEDEKDERWLIALQRDILMAKMPLEMTIAKQEMTLRDVVELEAGDIIPIELPETFKLKANKVPVFNCTMGVSRGNLAVKVVDQIVRPK
jgi:flagellar motor switch protein FliM